MSKEDADTEQEIVASGEALRTVAGWLGVADVEEVMDKEGLNAEFEMGRQQGLGLGAKFLPHNKAVALTSGVEHRLGSKLKRSAERCLAAEMKDVDSRHQQSGLLGQRRGFGIQQGRKGDKAAARQQQGQQPAGAASQANGSSGGGGGVKEEDSEDEEDGRGKAFGTSKTLGHKPASFTRSDLLKTDGAAHGKKRKRRKSGLPGASPAVGPSPRQ